MVLYVLTVASIVVSHKVFLFSWNACLFVPAKENVLPHHMVVMGMSLAGFELLSFEHDVETKCDGNLRRDGGRGVKDYNDLPKIVQHARCTQNGWVKYYHVLFRRINDDRILQLS